VGAGPAAAPRPSRGATAAALVRNEILLRAAEAARNFEMRTTPKPYRKSYWRRALNAVVRPLAKLGLTGPRTHLLTVPGRRTGKPWSTPVSIVQEHGERWLVAPYGERNWVKNARAAGWVRLRRGSQDERLAVEELSPEDAVPVLRRYYELAYVTRTFFDVSLESSHDEWVTEAQHHPVFRVVHPGRP
jgi:deazaflavin-dependent oxidoreductase (nitroreductase family)